ncbi:transcriptional regulator, AraC family [Tenacibaculum sp. MAR_2009_124]|uniref:AraC family transcriptional regulator n=1 Tax=Tenacibaculum sp. MAR_2009_124 TaxID=1250059 RepID=UPI00089B92A3|nr:AraC family transcriptional regulator [Tenacibaculum sp. MAR_2009_124]SEC43078.1 transcriptional regulator, AraC family [Tenacibaculum sp. MAR_2009_124]
METKEFYKYRLQQVVSYLRTSYNLKISIQELENLSNFSYRNLQRVFKGYYGETIGAYVTRIKLENGAKKLLFTSEEIKIIAEEIGYADVQTFSKSFKKHFGISPAVYRSKKENLFRNNKIIEKQTMPFFEEKITVLPKMELVYTTFKGDYYSIKIDTLWNDFLNEVEALAIDTNNVEYFGIIWDEPIISEAIHYNYDACIRFHSINISNQKFRVKTLKEQKYAVFTHVGPYQRIDKTYDKIFSRWLFTTDKEVSEAPFIEKYIKHEGNTDDVSLYETEIYIPLKG